MFYPVDTDRLIRIDRLPRWGLGAQKNKYAMRMTQSQLVYQAYIQPHRSPNLRDVIAIDIDSDLDLQKLKDDGIPLPATVVGRPWNVDQRQAARDACLPWTKRPHLRWMLEIPVMLPRDGLTKKQLSSARRQQYLYNRVRDELIRRLEALGFNVDRKEPVITKNPVSEEWHVVEGDVREWKLTELKEALGLTDEEPVINDDRAPGAKKSSQQRWYQRLYASADKYFRPEIAAGSRTYTLFESIRGLAYAYKSQCSSHEELHAFLHQEAVKIDQMNNRRRPMDTVDIRSTVKSVAKWTWEVYQGTGGDGKDRGACYRAGLINAGMTPTHRKSVGGKYASQKRASNAKARVLKLHSEWQAADKDVTISGLARELRMDRKTVRKYLAEKPAANDNKVVSRGGDLSGHKGLARLGDRVEEPTQDKDGIGIRSTDPVRNQKITISDILVPKVGPILLDSEVMETPDQAKCGEEHTYTHLAIAQQRLKQGRGDPPLVVPQDTSGLSQTNDGKWKEIPF
ncbi:primase C-terminal domain-containing protein [Ruegeria sp. HKCCSP335]|uniref:primase C-terminal domain-containing protein n=1 Tax=Ruegeria sp. HKCCSP335 TaxID=2794833 RepID=UPI001AEB01CF|nr:primase C-terminal domain-containing protein [Ruegeria sp. HKCCSP335]